MREIKFRAWSVERNLMIYPDNNGWYDGAFTHENGYLQTVQLATVVKDERLDALQYTGLKDKNGREIYEGDIVCCFTTSYSLVVQKQYAYGLDTKGIGFKPFYEVYGECEILGNIYENSELLEGTK